MADFDRTANAASQLLAWLNVAGLPCEGGRTYLTPDLKPLVEQFQEEYTAVCDALTGSCKELIEGVVSRLSSSKTRTILTDVDRDTLTRGLALFSVEARDKGNGE